MVFTFGILSFLRGAAPELEPHSLPSLFEPRTGLSLAFPDLQHNSHTFRQSPEKYLTSPTKRKQRNLASECQKPSTTTGFTDGRAKAVNEREKLASKADS